MPRRLLLLLLVFALVATACSPREEELRGLRTCGDLTADDDFGNTREIDGADVILFSRPGRFTTQEAADVSGLSGEVLHVSRSVGPCGQHDLFFTADEGQRCVAVVGRIWDADVCWDAALDGPAMFPLVVPDDINGSAFVVWAPGGRSSHVLIESDGLPDAAAFISGSVALAVLPSPPSNVAVVGTDGSRQSVKP